MFVHVLPGTDDGDKRPQDKKTDKSWGGWHYYSWGFAFKNKFLRGITTQKLQHSINDDDTTTKRHVLGTK